MILGWLHSTPGAKRKPSDRIRAEKQRNGSGYTSKKGNWKHLRAGHIPYPDLQSLALCGEHLTWFEEHDSLDGIRVCKVCISRFEAEARKGSTLFRHSYLPLLPPPHQTQDSALSAEYLDLGPQAAS